MRLRNRPELIVLRKALRAAPTPAETLLWRHLKGRRLGGIRFRRQFSVGPYVLDFFSPGHALAVELDGSPHDSDAAQTRDRARDAFLAAHGIRVLRFENNAVRDSPEAVVAAIFQALHESHPSCSRSE
jgi:very-short-patch-repair endonuclease